MATNGDELKISLLSKDGAVSPKLAPIKKIKKKHFNNPNIKKVNEYFESIRNDLNVVCAWKRYFENEKSIVKCPQFSERLIVANYRTLCRLIPDEDFRKIIRTYIKVLKNCFLNITNLC